MRIPDSAVKRLRVCYVSPTYFAPESCIGGGERYAEELALAMAEAAEVKLVSFGPRAFRERRSMTYERVVLKNWTSARMSPFSPQLFLEVSKADVIHCFQYYTLPTFVSSLFGRLRGARVFITDLGGGGWTPGFHIDQSRWTTAQLPISQYASCSLPGRNKVHRIIYGGVDLGRYAMRGELVHDGSAVFLGRILPHKGIHVLIEGLPSHIPLHVIGSEHDAAYLEYLRRLASNKNVDFHFGLSDAEVVPYLQRAMALVHPTPVDSQGSAGANELFGLAAVEAMACGCPVIASNAASLPEIVQPAVSGILVPPNRPSALKHALGQLEDDSDLWRSLSNGARHSVEKSFTWRRVVERCLGAYQAESGRESGGLA